MGRYSNEFRERGVRLAMEAMRSGGVDLEEALGCSPQTRDKWLKQAARDTGKRAGLTTDERARLKDLEHENRELNRANDIFRKASAFFAQAELGRGRK